MQLGRRGSVREAGRGLAALTSHGCREVNSSLWTLGDVPGASPRGSGVYRPGAPRAAVSSAQRAVGEGWGWGWRVLRCLRQWTRVGSGGTGPGVLGKTRKVGLLSGQPPLLPGLCGGPQTSQIPSRLLPRAPVSFRE